MKRYLTLPLLLTVQLVFCQTHTPAPGNWIDSLTPEISKLMLKYHIVGAGVSINDPNGLCLQQTYGYANLETKLPTSDQTVFKIASISKVFTAFATMQLVESKKIDLDAAVQQYIPEFNPQHQYPDQPITIRHLLSHTAGLTDDINNGSYCTEVPNQSTIIEALNKEVLTLPPGLMNNYSNAGYALLGCIVERVSGQSYADYVKAHIFKPLGMNNSYIGGEKPLNLTEGYWYDSLPEPHKILRDVSAGGIACSQADIQKMVQLILDHGSPLISAASFEEMTRNQLVNTTLQTDEGFGLGLFIKSLGTDHDDQIGPGFGHAGDIRTHHALLMVYPKIPLAFVITANSEKGARFANALAIAIVRTYFQQAKGEKIDKALNPVYSKVALEADRIDHDRISGTYGGGGEAFIRIKKSGKNKLRFLQDGKVLALKREANNTYQTRFLLLKFIPIRVKDLSFAFRQSGGEIYMKTLMNKSKSAMYISRRDPDTPLSTSWTLAQGNYTAVNEAADCHVMVPYQLKCLGNKIIVYRKGEKEEEEDEIGFNAISTNVAVSDGLSRGAGSTLLLLRNGNLYFSGFELSKTTPEKPNSTYVKGSMK
ncbi:MAG: beta-lactamase family protein [Lewinellaceae bacterium]|nr:beta-lactamase family protein [Lewinellaceae bacterium]